MPRLLLTLLIPLLLGGCSSIDTQIDRTKPLGSIQRFFVLANGNDSRALDRHIVNALRARGFTAESGPRTMMPDDTEAVIHYVDNWTWDFGDRLVYLQIGVRDQRSGEPIGSMQYSARIPGRQPVGEIITGLISQLFAAEK
jgi:hypothetical protein